MVDSLPILSIPDANGAGELNEGEIYLPCHYSSHPSTLTFSFLSSFKFFKLFLIFSQLIIMFQKSPRFDKIGKF